MSLFCLGLTENEIIAQAMVFLVAGFGTTSDTLCWLCYELALNPEIQDELIEEVDEVTKGVNSKGCDLNNIWSETMTV